MQDVAETQEKAGLKEECIEFYDKVSVRDAVQVSHLNVSMQISSTSSTALLAISAVFE